MTVVSDTSPLNYLIQTGHVDVLPALFDRILVPFAVYNELAHELAPAVVRGWLSHTPDWFEVGEIYLQQGVSEIDRGEAEAIEMARSLGVLVLLDDKRGREFAMRQGVLAIGTIGIIDRAGRRGLLSFADAIRQLEATNFHISKDILNTLLEDWNGD